ncbi:hypothetical protein HispidOSU_027574, partial [Sigmodon hispidus]
MNPGAAPSRLLRTANPAAGAPHCSGSRADPTPASPAQGCTQKRRAAAFPPPQPRRAIKGPAIPVRLTIAAFDFHVNPDLDLAEVGRCHHLIRSGGGRAEQAGRGRGGDGRGSYGPRPCGPGRQRGRERGRGERRRTNGRRPPGKRANGRMDVHAERRGE